VARSETKIRDGAAPFLEAGETVLAAFIARPRGWTQATGAPASGVDGGDLIGAFGESKQERNIDAAKAAGFPLANPVALAITQRRLLSFAISNPIGFGIAVKVKELVGAVPLRSVDAIEVKRLALGKVVNVTVDGVPFRLEAGAGANARGVAEALDRAKEA
jgi:hypothetical protein